jgi:sugar lactone lactonase YvrE
VPERPLQLLFGGANKRTLFILTHHALYATQIN